ncbi:Ger(x)C family spore germination protein [Bacillus sp. USDA818B3_A]|uniref:Ger(x)C family spore germination protein n=1 Tax=Bacillus sp. USDA818B3_A TaxID=2698834 RepID=UPI00136DAEC0|nr:Ger(x)C family spore germination protein [Bacillus sp. USDA818B3_A]
MRNSTRVIFLLLLSTLITTGCWDRRELNDLAIVLGWGMDLNKDGTYLSSAQIVVPAKLGNSGGGGKGSASAGEGFYIESATGKTATDTSQNMQTKLSRKIFASHRRVIVIGEDLARSGIGKIMDEFSRNPEVRMRTDLFVVRGSTAQEFLSIPYQLESIPALAPLKIQERISGRASSTFKQFLVEANAEGSNPTLPTVQIVRTSEKGDTEQVSSKTLRVRGRAIFNNKLQMIGFISPADVRNRYWIRGELKENTLTVYVPEGKGTISFVGRKYKSKIKPILQGDQIKFTIRLSGKGVIRENNTNLDLKNPSHLKAVERALNKEIPKKVLQTITHVQKDYEADIFGLGEVFHRKYPGKWKEMKANWQKEFSRADVVVIADLNVDQVGLTGPSLHLMESEIKE